MSHSVIHVQNLSKFYRLGLIGGGTLHEDLNRWWAKARGKPDPLLKVDAQTDNNQGHEKIWALKNINLIINQGEILGIIGRNGAGKSTLLKILSRITAPTSGRVKIKGRVGSLLEVGTGFHPELTGRENIYLNGAILGMKRAEITAKFDEIVAFSEISKFIDTPAKRYSSGMTVRLAFAVAAHLEPEILIIDEVLAVGDASFQKKCLGKMEDVSKQGRTVLFVSHNMGAVRQLCSRAALLRNGQITQLGQVDDVINNYLTGTVDPYASGSYQKGEYIQRLAFLNRDMCESDTFLAGEAGNFRIDYDTGRDILYDVVVTVAVYDQSGFKVIQLTTLQSHKNKGFRTLEGKGRIICELGKIHLTTGAYRINVALDGMRGGIAFHDSIVNACQWNILPSDFYGTSRMKPHEEGVVLVKNHWSVQQD